MGNNESLPGENNLRPVAAERFLNREAITA